MNEHGEQAGGQGLTAKQLRQLLEETATPKATPLPLSVARMLPASGRGFYWRMMTTPELLDLQRAMDAVKARFEPGGDGHECVSDSMRTIAGGSDVTLLRLSFALCDAQGELVCKGDVANLRRILTIKDIETLVDALKQLEAGEEMQAGKGSASAPAA